MYFRQGTLYIWFGDVTFYHFYHAYIMMSSYSIHCHMF